MALGPEIPASCIKNRMKNLRAKAVAMGIMASTPTSHAHAKGPATGKPQKKARKATEVNDTDDDDEDEGFSDETSRLSKSSMDIDSDEERSKAIKPDPFLQQHKTIGGRITKLRSSPRKNPRVNYKVLFDEENTFDEDRLGVDKKASSHVGRDVNIAEGIVKAEI